MYVPLNDVGTLLFSSTTTFTLLLTMLTSLISLLHCRVYKDKNQNFIRHASTTAGFRLMETVLLG